MSCITIYHNPHCGTSRNTLAMIRQSGVVPNIVEYLHTPPSRAELKALLQSMGMTVREVLREKGTPYAALDLGNPQWTDEQLLDFVEQHPILLNRADSSPSATFVQCTESAWKLSRCKCCA